MENNKRKADAVTILGLDTATPDLNVKDGLCEVLNNLRYKADGWRNIPPFKNYLKVSNSQKYRVLYKHPATEENKYIAVVDNATSSNLYELYHATDSSGVVSFKQSQTLLSHAATKYEITHFGNVLIVQTSPQSEVFYFVWEKGKYRRYQVPNPVSLSYTVERMKIAPNYWNYENTGCTTTFLPIMFNRAITAASWRIYNITKNETIALTNDGTNNFWFGEMALFVAFKMIDGTTLSPSMPIIIESYYHDGWAAHPEVCKNRIDSNDDNIYLELCLDNIYYKPLTLELFKSQIAHNRSYLRIKPTLKIELNDTDIDTNLIDRVTVYGTRISHPYDYKTIATGSLNDHVQWLKENSGEKVKRITHTELFGDNKDIMKEPFYFIKDIKIENFKNGVYNLEIGNDLMKDIEQNTVYEPNQSLHSMNGSVYHEYNNRIHMGDIQTVLFSGYAPKDFLSESSTTNQDTYVVIGVNANNKTYYVNQKASKGATRYRTYSYQRDNLKILSYPDYRATEWNIYSIDKSNSLVYHRDKKELEPSAALNIAFYVRPSVDTQKYPIIRDFTGGGSASSIPDDKTIRETNRVQVSALNNLFNLPFDLSYFVGARTATIQAFDTVADQLSDSKFGEFPMYVFTDDGVWAMQNGTNDIVYSNIIPINHDKIINKNTVAAAYNVFYITNRGLMALKGKYATLLSQPINDKANNIMLDYLKDADLYFQHLNNEIIIHNESYNYAYLYSIDGGLWSTRDFAGRKINTDFVVDSTNTLYHFEEELPDVLTKCSLITRPIKFGTSEFKRLETLIVRLQSDISSQQIEVKIEGSNDLKEWEVLRFEKIASGRDITIRRTPLSCKYYRFTLNMAVTGYLTLNYFHTELYHRFLHRLR